MLESCKQALDKYHQVDKVMLCASSSVILDTWMVWSDIFAVCLSLMSAAWSLCTLCTNGPDTLLDISVEFSLMVCCQLSAWSPECICLLSNADAGITSGNVACSPDRLPQALFGPSASQHSFELQDCAEHLHQHIISLRHQHSLTPEGHEAGGSSPPVIVHSSTTAEATTVIGRRSGPKPTGADGAGNAAGARKAQAKARQAAMMARMKQQQARFKDAGSEGDAPNVDKVTWTWKPCIIYDTSGLCSAVFGA